MRDFQVQMSENGGEKIFIDKKTRNKVKIRFLAVINKKIKSTWCDLECKLERVRYS